MGFPDIYGITSLSEIYSVVSCYCAVSMIPFVGMFSKLNNSIEMGINFSHHFGILPKIAHLYIPFKIS